MDIPSALERRFKARLFIANKIRFLRVLVLRMKGYDIAFSAIIERTVKLDKLYTRYIHIGANTLVAGVSTILSHDHCERVGNN